MKTKLHKVKLGDPLGCAGLAAMMTGASQHVGSELGAQTRRCKQFAHKYESDATGCGCSEPLDDADPADDLQRLVALVGSSAACALRLGASSVDSHNASSSNACESSGKCASSGSE